MTPALPGSTVRVGRHPVAPLPDRATKARQQLMEAVMALSRIHRHLRDDAARVDRERREAREAKRWQGVDGAPLDTSPVRSPWVMRAIAGTLPASDRTNVR